MFKHVIFDFDGTIADSIDLSLVIYNELAKKYHYRTITIEELREMNNLPIKERLKKIGIPLYRIPQLILETMGLYKKNIHLLKTFDGIKEVLIKLKKEGYVLSIISSNSVENIQSFLTKHHLDYFDHIVSEKNLFGKHKSMHRYCRQHKLHPNDILYIGDEIRDIEACRLIPIKIISVAWGFDSLELLKSRRPDYLANRPSDVLSIIKSIS